MITTPIPPPPGYENVDIAAPKDLARILHHVIRKWERVMEEGVMPKYNNLPPRKNTTASEPVDQQPETTGKPWWLWLAVGGTVVLLLTAIHRVRHNQQTRVP
ncbi:MAG: hypothetical protein QM755_18035 [Luteolibacter sp.]